MFNIDSIVKALQSDQQTQRTVVTGAAGLAAGMLLSGGGLGRLVGNTAKLGAAAAIGGLAWSAWQKYQQNQSGAATSAPESFIPPPGAAQEELGRSLVRAMIAAAKADGRIDADEKDRIFKRLETMPLSAEEKAFVFDELSRPLDIEAVVRSADTPEHAAEIYAASLVAAVPDSPAEQEYLATLASRLKLDPALVQHIHAAALAPAA